jgi:ABC-type phosphate transport system permease subunit
MLYGGVEKECGLSDMNFVMNKLHMSERRQNDAMRVCSLRTNKVATNPLLGTLLVVVSNLFVMVSTNQWQICIQNPGASTHCKQHGPKI